MKGCELDPFLFVCRLTDSPSNISLAAKAVILPSEKLRKIAHIIERMYNKISNSETYGRIPTAGGKPRLILIGSKWWPNWKGLIVHWDFYLQSMQPVMYVDLT